MRVPFLLAGVLCGLVAVCVAGDEGRQSSSARFENASGIIRSEDLGRELRDPAIRGRLRSERAQGEDDDVTCYTVQSYLVKRQSRGSDAVEPAGYSTCQRASKFGVKATGEADRNPSR